ncbi:hypothetical protein E4U55_006416 [Claviceps digitariae]|nr:hypothetical protein E4U55_006416 [Claviceps digitariae]
MTWTLTGHLMTILWSLLHLLPCLMITAAAVVATSRDSVFRLAAVPCLLLTANRLFHEWASISTSVTINTALVGVGMFLLLQCTNFVILAKLDCERLQQADVFTAQSSLGSKLLRTTSLLLNLRGIGTTWRAKHVDIPSSTCSLAGENETTTAARLASQRRKYIIRQSLIVCWQYLFLDVAYQFSSSLAGRPSRGSDTRPDPFPMDFEFRYLGVSAKQWVVRVMVTIFAGLGPARIQIDLMYRLCGLSAVLIGRAEPQDWPPLFGSVREAYSLRRFWTYFLRRNVIRLPRHAHRARWDRHCHLFLVFLLSGLLHAAVNYHVISPTSSDGPLACIAFFASFPLGIAIEDQVSRIRGRLSREVASSRWREAAGRSQSGLGNRSALKLLGFIWVATWMTLTAPWMLFPRMRLPVEDSWLVPFSLTRYMGMPAAQTTLVLGGLLTKVGISGKI